MSWKQALGFGVFIWVLIFAIVSVFVAFKAYDNTYAKIAIVIIAGLLSFAVAGRIGALDVPKAAAYGLIWAATGLILDVLVTTKFNPTVFETKSIWVSYAFLILAPILRVRMKKR